jgi:hypothetical protein
MVTFVPGNALPCTFGAFHMPVSRCHGRDERASDTEAVATSAITIAEQNEVESIPSSA